MTESIENRKIIVNIPLVLNTIICTCGMEFILLLVTGKDKDENRVYEQGGFYFCPYCGIADDPEDGMDEGE